MSKTQLVPHVDTERRIYLVRGQRVMRDRELAELYGVTTAALNQAVRRNLDRFPEDFMFQLAKEEFWNWRSQIVRTIRRVSEREVWPCATIRTCQTRK